MKFAGRPGGKCRRMNWISPGANQSGKLLAQGERRQEGGSNQANVKSRPENEQKRSRTKKDEAQGKGKVRHDKSRL